MPNSMIYKPAKTCTMETFAKEWQECQKVNTALIEEIETKAIKNGGLLHRFLPNYQRKQKNRKGKIMLH